MPHSAMNCEDSAVDGVHAVSAESHQNATKPQRGFNGQRWFRGRRVKAAPPRTAGNHGGIRPADSVTPTAGHAPNAVQLEGNGIGVQLEGNAGSGVLLEGSGTKPASVRNCHRWFRGRRVKVAPPRTSGNHGGIRSAGHAPNAVRLEGNAGGGVLQEGNSTKPPSLRNGQRWFRGKRVKVAPPRSAGNHGGIRPADSVTPTAGHAPNAVRLEGNAGDGVRPKWNGTKPEGVFNGQRWFRGRRVKAASPRTSGNHGGIRPADSVTPTAGHAPNAIQLEGNGIGVQLEGNAGSGVLLEGSGTKPASLHNGQRWFRGRRVKVAPPRTAGNHGGFRPADSVTPTAGHAPNAVRLEGNAGGGVRPEWNGTKPEGVFNGQRWFRGRRVKTAPPRTAGNHGVIRSADSVTPTAGHAPNAVRLEGNAVTGVQTAPCDSQLSLNLRRKRWRKKRNQTKPPSPPQEQEEEEEEEDWEQEILEVTQSTWDQFCYGYEPYSPLDVIDFSLRGLTLQQTKVVTPLSSAYRPSVHHRRPLTWRRVSMATTPEQFLDAE